MQKKILMTKVSVIFAMLGLGLRLGIYVAIEMTKKFSVL